MGGQVLSYDIIKKTATIMDMDMDMAQSECGECEKWYD